MNSKMFSKIGCFDGTFSLQLKEGGKPYQGLSRCMAQAIHKPFKEEQELLQ